MKEINILNPENVTIEESGVFSVREAARAVVVDECGMIALLYVARDDYYKLPGGGIEGSEDPITALKRECQEEIGCEIEVSDELGLITEYRKKFSIKQISYCYVARVSGEKKIPEFTNDEIEHEFEVVWLTFDDAKAALERSSLQEYESIYIVPRDQTLLEAAKKYLQL